MCVYTGFCYLFRTFSGINTDSMRTSSPHGDQTPVLMRQDMISEVLAKSRGEVWTEVRLQFGYGMNWLRLGSG